MRYFLTMMNEGFSTKVTTYFVSADTAHFMYREFAKYPAHSDNMPTGGAEEAWSKGTKLSSGEGYDTTILWGNSRISEKEIFKQALKGKLTKWRD